MFNSVDGSQTDGLVAIDPSGAVLPWSSSGSQRVLTVAASDSTVCAGGSFSEISGQPRVCLAALDAMTGAVRDWYPAPDGIVWSISRHEGTVYIGGSFERVGNWPQASLALVSGADDHARPIPRTLSFACSPNPTRGPALIRYSLPPNDHRDAQHLRCSGSTYASGV